MSREIPRAYEIKSGSPLLILSCSATKRTVPARDWVRIADLYCGPLWCDMRASGFPRSNVAAISALYGFCEPGQAIQTYDVKMDAERSARICGESDHASRFAAAVRRAGAAFIVGGGMYQELARTAIRLWPDLAPLVRFASGSFLQQRKQLGEWLRANQGDMMKTPQVPAMPGMSPLGFMRPVSQDQAALAQRKANAPLKPKVAQVACDVGLFGDDMLQSDLIDRGRR